MGRNNPDEQERISAASGRSGPNAALIAFGVVAALVLVFFFRNGGDTKLDFMLFEWDTTVRWSIFVSIALGVVLDRMFSIWWRRKRRSND